MTPDEFLSKLKDAHDGKQLVDLLVQANIAIAPPMKCPFPPEEGTKVACLANTPWFPAGTRGEVKEVSRLTYLDGEYDNGYWIVSWESYKKEKITREKHEAYQFVYVY